MRIRTRMSTRARAALVVLGASALLGGTVTIAGARSEPAKQVEVAAKACSPELSCRPGEDIPAGTSGSLRFNIGGGDVVDHHGNTWRGVTCEGDKTYVSPNPIDGTVDDALFQSRQFAASCHLPVPDGTYEITAGWAETYKGRPGYRTFTLEVEGQPRGTVDVAAAAGKDRSLLATFDATVTDGLDIAVRKQRNQPMLALVMATPAGEAGATDPATAPGDAPATPAPDASAPADTTPPTAEPAQPSPTPETTAPAPVEAAPVETPVEAAPPPATGDVLTVGKGQRYATLQAALDAAQPGQTVQLATPGDHKGPAATKRDGTAGRPITITAVDGALLTCSTGDGRCLSINHSSYRVQSMHIRGGTQNIYVQGLAAGKHVHDVKILDNVLQGISGTGECVRVKYQASDVEIARNDISDCGLGKCCDSSKNGEAVYLGTAPEQLAEKNPSGEVDRTHDVWVHHNVLRPYNECVDMKEGTYGNLVEHNICSGQRDPDSGAFGSRGGRVGEGNVFRDNEVRGALGACVRFGGDAAPDGTGNEFVDNTCRDIRGEYGVKEMRTPQGRICGNVFTGTLPAKGLSREGADPTAAC